MRQKAVFSEHELTREALKAVQGSASLDEIRTAIKANEKEMLIENTNTYKVGVDHKNSETTLYSSKEILRSEANIEKAVSNGKNTGALMSKEEFAKHFETIESKKISEAKESGKEYHSLTEGQRGALDHIATSKDKFIGIQGDAGSGKTTALERMTRMVEILKQVGSDHIELIGLAPTNIAAGNIEKDAGIKSRTVDSFIHKPDTPTEGKQQVYLVDESSMLDTVKMEKLTQIARKTTAKVVFIGDVKQLKPVSAGSMFDRLQKTGQMDFAHVTEVLRQKDGTVAKEVVTAFKNVETLGNGLDKLQDAGKLIQAKDGDMSFVREAFINNVAADYLAGHEASKLQKDDRPKDLKEGINSILALVSTNADRHEFNNQIREKLVEAGAVNKEGQKHQTLEAKRLDHIDTKFAGSYKVGDVLVADKMQGDIKSGMRAEISGINREDNTIKLSYTTRGGVEKEKWINAAKVENFSAFSKVEKEFAAGDKIAFERKDNSIGVQNGDTGIIKSIDDKGVWQVDKDGTAITVDPKEYPFVSHGYAMTVHKSQGQSIDRVHVFADSSKGGLSTNAGYVQMSRAKYELTVYTDDRVNLEKQYKQEQLAENAGERIDTKQFADEKPVEQHESGITHDFDDPNGIQAPKFDPVDKSMNLEEQREEGMIKAAKLEQKQIDSHIKEMRSDASAHDQKSQEHWNASKRFDQTQQTRAHNVFYAARAGAVAKDLKGGIRYQQLLKTEAKIMEHGSIDLKASREFMEKKGFENPHAKAGFLASQARQQEHLEKMLNHGILVRDPKNEEKYHLAVSRSDFKNYRESERSHDSRSDIAQGEWNKAFGDKLFSMAQSRTDATLIAGGKWNPKEAIANIKHEGLYTKDTQEVFERLQARYDRLAREGVVKKSGSGYEALNKTNFKNFVQSREDKADAYRGEGESSQQWREIQKGNARNSFFQSGGRIDDAIKHTTHVNLHTWSKDIKNSYKSASHMLNVKGFGGAAVAGTIGIVLGTSKTATRAIAGLVYKMTKAVVKETANAIGATASSIVAGGQDREKMADLISGKSFEERLKEATSGKNSQDDFVNNIETIVNSLDKKSSRDEAIKSSDGQKETDKTFSERMNEASGREERKSDDKVEKEAEKSSGENEKEAEKVEERERD